MRSREEMINQSCHQLRHRMKYKFKKATRRRTIIILSTRISNPWSLPPTLSDTYYQRTQSASNLSGHPMLMRLPSPSIHRLDLAKLDCVLAAALASASAVAILRLSAGIKDADAWLSANSLTDPIFREPSPVEDAIIRNTIMYSLLYSCPVID